MPHEHDHDDQCTPSKQPPKSGRIPPRDGNQAHVNESHGAHRVEHITEFIPKGAPVDVVLKAKQKDAQGQEGQSHPDSIPGRVLCRKPLRSQVQGLTFKTNVEQSGKTKRQRNGQ
jgi:hypothetical protein